MAESRLTNVGTELQMSYNSLTALSLSDEGAYDSILAADESMFIFYLLF